MRNSIIRGTFILTAAGFISRIIGFYYRIFLSNAIGSEGMGLYQLIFPIFLLAFAICVGGIETAISKFVAEGRSANLSLMAGIFLSLSLSLCMTFILFLYADFFSDRILLNPSCAHLIRLLSLAIPFVSVENCINGYYYGQKKATVPAMSQLFEQTIRVLAVYVAFRYLLFKGNSVHAELAVYGLVAGEIASFLFCIISLILKKDFKIALKGLTRESIKILKLAFPLSINRILLTLLQSGEAILIPAQLIIFGLTNSEALSIYGVLTGMALPFILFPSAITNSVSVFLLPTVSKAQSEKNNQTISFTISNSIKYSLIMGIFCTTIFIFYGAQIGEILFHDPNVGYFVEILAWLCPFLYITTTLGSILNGLGKTTATCMQNVAGISIRIAFLILCVPKYGITGYMWGLLISQIFVCSAHILTILKMYPIKFNPFESIVLPVFYVIISLGSSFIIYLPMQKYLISNHILRLLIGASITSIIYICIYSLKSNFMKRKLRRYRNH